MSATLERGFKSWAERTAASLRADLSLSTLEPLDPRVLATYLQVRLITPSDIPGIPQTVLKQLLNVDPWGWSALTIMQGDAALVIYNPKHSAGRQASDIAHELAHIILGHEAAKLIMSADGQLVMRTYDQKQEDEANWLAWALLLPRDALLHNRKMRVTAKQIAQRYCVTETLVQFRMRVTGVEAQLRARKPLG
jgi:IrrE N-terminal-like domain